MWLGLIKYESIFISVKLLHTLSGIFFQLEADLFLILVEYYVIVVKEV